MFLGGSSYSNDSGVQACGSVVVKGTPMQVLQLLSDRTITAPERPTAPSWPRYDVRRSTYLVI